MQAELDNRTWKPHCTGLFQTLIADDQGFAIHGSILAALRIRALMRSVSPWRIFPSLTITP